MKRHFDAALGVVFPLVMACGLLSLTGCKSDKDSSFGDGGADAAAMGTSSDSAPAGLQSVTPGTITPAPPSGTTHVVVEGDYLWDLATRYNTSVLSIQEANNLTSDKIIIGQTLIIPGSGASSLPSATNPVTIETIETVETIETMPSTITTVPPAPPAPPAPTTGTLPGTTFPMTLPPEPPALREATPTLPPAPPTIPSVPSLPPGTLPPAPPTDLTVPGTGFEASPVDPLAPSGFQINP